MKTFASTIILVLLLAVAPGSNISRAAEKAAAVPKEYPLKKCPVSGETYGDGGMVPYKVSHDGTDVWLCCDHCKPKFDKDPDKHTRAVKEAAEKK